MLLPESSGVALLAAVFSACCWGTWGNALKFTQDVKFELFYMNFSVGVFLISLLAAFTLGMVHQDGTRTFVDEFDGSVAFDRFAYAFAGGVVFNMANLLLCKGITMLGLALAFPLCIGTALVLGTAVTYAVKPSGNAVLLFSGVGVAFLAVCLGAVVHALKEQQQRQQGNVNFASEPLAPTEEGPSTARKVVVCIVGGILMGLWNPLVTLAEKDGGLSPYGEFVFYTLATLLSSSVFVPLVLVCPIDGGKPVAIRDALAEYSRAPRSFHVWSLLGGLFWAMGTLANAVAGASGHLSSAESYAIGQCANMIAILWGVLYFGEFAGTGARVQALLALVCVLYLAAIALVASAS